MKQWVGLLDCNNFFVSCERLFRPDLRGVPVAVLSSNDGCVVARSKEIKDKGIPMGVPYFQIKDIIKDIGAVTFSSHFALYRDISKRVFEAMRSELDVVEQYSVDEAFFYLEGDTAHVERMLFHLKDKVEREVGIPVSVAAASSKTQAKYANSISKRTSGICVLGEVEWREMVDRIRLVELWGVAHKSATQYERKAVKTVGELTALPRQVVEQQFGVHGVRLWSELRGEQAIVIHRTAATQKSIISSRSFAVASGDREVVKDAVAYHVRHAAEDLRAMRKKAGFIQVSIMPSRHGDYVLQGATLGSRLEQPTADTFILLEKAMELVEVVYKSGVPYKKAGILLTDFIPEAIEQQTLFSESTPVEKKKLLAVIDSINQAARGEVLQIGSRLRTNAWQSAHEKKSPAYTTNWSQLKVVKA